MFILKKFVSNIKNKILLSLLFIGLIFQFVAFKTVGTHLPHGLGLENTTQENIKASEKSIKELKSFIESGDPPENAEELLKEFNDEL